MDQYRTAETWTGIPGAIAPADGNAVAAVFRPRGLDDGATEAPDQNNPPSKEGGYSDEDLMLNVGMTAQQSVT